MRARQRRLRVEIAVLIIIVAGTLLGPARASAITYVTCEDIYTSYHCYDTADLGPITQSGKGFQGVATQLRATCMYQQYAGAGDFVSSDTWLESRGTYWIEAGIAHGSRQLGTRDYFFWADQRPGSLYFEHDDATDPVSRGASYTQRIRRHSTPGEYGVLIGPYGGASTGWPNGQLFDEVYTGSETYNNGGTGNSAVRAGHSDLAFYDENNALHSGWAYAGLHTNIENVPLGWGFTIDYTGNFHYGTGTYDGDC